MWTIRLAWCANYVAPPAANLRKHTIPFRTNFEASTTVLKFSVLNRHPMLVTENNQQPHIEATNHSSASNLWQDLLPGGF